jgi:hypothetical protein
VVEWPIISRKYNTAPSSGHVEKVDERRQKKFMKQVWVVMLEGKDLGKHF